MLLKRLCLVTFLSLVPMCCAESTCAGPAQRYCCALLAEPDDPVILDIADQVDASPDDFEGPGKVGALCDEPNQSGDCDRKAGLVPVCCKGKASSNNFLVNECASLD